MKSRKITKVIVCTSLKSNLSFHYIIDANGDLSVCNKYRHWSVPADGYNDDELVLYAPQLTEKTIEFANTLANSFDAILDVPKTLLIKKGKKTDEIDLDPSDIVIE